MNMMLGIESWTLARPELFLAAVTALLLVYGVVRGEVATAFVSIATVLAIARARPSPRCSSSIG
jgi:NADH-quinone oxidoreductase subunit N